MSIDLTDEQRAFVDAVADFCRRETGTREQRGDGPHHPDIYRKMADLGWLGVTVPDQYGGAGAGMVDTCLFLEQVGYGQAPVGGFTTSAIVAAAVERSGSEPQKKTVLGGLATGRVYAIAMSEPEAGSDVANLSCRAVLTDDGYVINGQKTWCSNAHIADAILLVARTGGHPGDHHGLTMLLVPTDAAGLRISGIETMGGREVNDLYFTDVVVPADAVVGTVDRGWQQLMAGLNVERLILAALMLGTAQRAFDDALDFIKQRKQFGRPVGSFQALRHRVADLATEIECCRLLVHRVATLADRDPHKVLPRESSMVKLKTTEVARQVALAGMQMMGGYGYATEYDMERHVRATLVSTIYGGTSEIQRDIIGKTYGL
ncbi:acyl-CoA dehydrogenase [Actinoplanes lobatus]|uniref:Acyl-CoA dehydrogenase n=1 Tax=Actinoplanes lobatus TaxID=113568 RepID=A0A7W7MM44_9ACTN|nr:acyl-CoA dehydrogenase family protein [Actinoplanes lobatus]MBB4755208.1 alkylation response protein AidB-like acyl-CoA dehydrogenase [Actinoplanes lobatus]GGN88864.1 acyl-CoA dehydrogenase [Actinoplanes lobatus]GIE43414.1 acyl-CoA dehydrogenase [Actinoplanes lobatus]